MTIYVCKTKDVVQLSEQVYRVRLIPDDESLFDFQGGQYILLQMPSGELVPLSIASSPEQKNFLELHLRLTHTPSLAEDMINLFRLSETIKIEGAFGNCYLKESERDIVIVAGGTGFSPMKSLLESAFSKDNSRQFDLFLGAQNVEGLYQNDLIKGWQKDHENFRYTPVISDEDSSWQGEIGFPHQVAIEQLNNSLLDKEIFIAGSEPMVMAVYQSFLEEGVSKQQIHSDILDIKRESGDVE